MPKKIPYSIPQKIPFSIPKKNPLVNTKKKPYLFYFKYTKIKIFKIFFSLILLKIIFSLSLSLQLLHITIFFHFLFTKIFLLLKTKINRKVQRKNINYFWGMFFTLQVNIPFGHPKVFLQLQTVKMRYEILTLIPKRSKIGFLDVLLNAFWTFFDFGLAQ